ncbi:hypothetical protein [Borrelia persica]|uniref:hypothetical protein n=1 Tax=Borrelia persica TaxID=44448 RepID=UPI0004668F8D|nr:hypothetical protein [Borrelia persica]
MRRVFLILGICLLSLIFFFFACDPIIFDDESELRNEAYERLKSTVLKHRDRFVNSANNFKKGIREIDIPFGEIVSIFSFPDFITSVCSAFGCDVTSLTRLIRIIARLDITSDLKDGDTKIVHDLLYFLKEVAGSIDEIINVQLKDEDLEKIGSNSDVSAISAITDAFEDAMNKEQALVSRMKEMILEIDPNGKKQAILQQLEDIMNDEYINASMHFMRDMAKTISKVVK